MTEALSRTQAKTNFKLYLPNHYGVCLPFITFIDSKTLFNSPSRFLKYTHKREKLEYFLKMIKYIYLFETQVMLIEKPLEATQLKSRIEEFCSFCALVNGIVFSK